MPDSTMDVLMETDDKIFRGNIFNMSENTIISDISFMIF